MYDYTDLPNFKLRLVDHDAEFMGLKDYQIFLVIGSLSFGLSDMTVGLVLVCIVSIFFRWCNRLAHQQKHVTLSKGFLLLCWKFGVMTLIFSHLKGIKETQQFYRS